MRNASQKDEAPVPEFDLNRAAYQGNWKSYVPQMMPPSSILSPLENLHRVAPYIDTSPGLSRTYSMNQGYAGNVQSSYSK